MSKQTKKPHILLLFNRMIPSVRLCGHYQLKELLQQGNLEYLAKQILEVKQADLEWADAVILGRADSRYEYLLARRLRKAGKPVAYILDDDLLNISGTSKSADYFRRPEIRKYIQRTLECSHAIFSPSPILLKKYAGDDSGRLGLLIEEPAVFVGVFEPHNESKPVKIGFAGSVDREQDVEHILKQTLLQIKKQYGSNVEFEFYGVCPTYAKALSAKVIPYCEDYVSYKHTLNGLGWDIGLAPMPDTQFHACKHYNKYIEYAGAGIVGVYSDVPPYNRLKAQGRTGAFVHNHPSAWLEALIGLIDNKEHLQNMRIQVYEHAKSGLNIHTVSKDFRVRLDELLLCAENSRKKHVILPWKAGYSLWKAFYFFKRNKFRLFQAVWTKATGIWNGRLRENENK